MHSPVPPPENTQRPATQPANSSYSSILHDIIFVCCGTSKHIVPYSNFFQLTLTLNFPVGAAYLIFLIVGVPIAMVYVGFTTTSDCPAEPMIPIYLTISGICSILRTIWYFLEVWLIRRRHIGLVFRQYINCALCVMTAGLATLYLLGIYWVISVAWPNLENIDAYNYCNPTTYLLAFVTVIGILVLITFWCLCICSLASQVVPVPGINEEISAIDIPFAASPQPNTIAAITILVPETA